MHGNRALLKEVVKAALDECPRLVTAIRQAVADDDATALRLAGHHSKGPSAISARARSSPTPTDSNGWGETAT
jgi:hypothetical protein